MYYTINDTTYWYEIHGEGDPVVLLHGFTGSTDTWKPIIELAPEFKYILIDLPGHGKTKSNRSISMMDCCHDLHHLFTEIGLESFYLLGYSMGGRTALSYACIYPENVKALLLESASPGLATEEERSERIQKDKGLAKKIEEEGLSAFVDFWENIPLFQTQKRLPHPIQQRIRNERLNQSEKGLAMSLRSMGTGSQPSWWDHLPTLSIPTLLIVGEEDGKFVQISKKMQNLMISCKLKICEQTGHAVHVENPKVFIKHVAEWIKSVNRNLKEDPYDS